MKFKNRSLVLFVLVLYISILAIGWAALKIINEMTKRSVQNQLEVEADKVIFFFESRMDQLDEIEKLVQKWWLRTGSLTEFSQNWPFQLQVLPNPRSPAEERPTRRINWEIKTVNSFIAFQLVLRTVIHDPKSDRTIHYRLDRNYFLHMVPWLNEKITNDLLIFDVDGVLQNASMVNEKVLTNFSESGGQDVFQVPDHIIRAIRTGPSFSIKYFDQQGSQLTIYFPLHLHGEIKAYFGLVYSTGLTDRTLAAFALLTVIILFAVTLILTGIYYFATTRLNNYLNRIDHFTKRVAQGDFLLRLEDRGISEFQNLNISLNQMAASLEKMQQYEKELIILDRLSSLAQLSSGIAHEIKNPLMVLQYSVNHIKKALHQPEQVEDLEMIERNVLKIGKVVEKLADFSRPADSEQREVLNLIQLFEETLYFLRKAFESHGTTLEFVPYPEQVFGSVKKTAIIQVFTNVLLNAIDAMPKGGHVDIRVDLIETEKIGSTALFIIKDTGEGIAPQDLHKVFNPFFTTKTHGTGLGLAIAYQIMVEHGGFIHIVSAVEGAIAKAPEAQTIINLETLPLQLAASGTLIMLGFPVALQPAKEED